MQDESSAILLPTNKTSTDPETSTTNESDDSSDAVHDNSRYVIRHGEVNEARKISAWKRQDAETFSDWLTKNKTKLGEQKVAREKGHHRKGDATDAFQLELQEKIIDSPRPYQVELFERARDHNTIIVLDTGSGKTLIAVLLLRYILEKELEDRHRGHPRKVAFFVAEKVALVHQQYEVLKFNLPYSVVQFWGDAVDSRWTAESWKECFDQNMIVVCTAAVLHSLLYRSFVSMDQVNLLVFDEAHHTKKNHLYARIVKDFYVHEPDLAKRPRILGMTASPVDSHTDVPWAAQQLETWLCSTIATVPDGSLQKGLTSSHLESQRFYSSLLPPFLTDLGQLLKPLLANNYLSEKPWAFSAWASSNLGSWCTDRFWKAIFTMSYVNRLQEKSLRSPTKFTNISSLSFREQIQYYSSTEHQKTLVDHDEGEREDEGGQDGTDEPLAKIIQAQRVIEQYQEKPLIMNTDSISSKVHLLYRLLREYLSHDEGHKCIVFVERRLAAFLLTTLFSSPAVGLNALRPTCIFGSNNDLGLDSMTYREQRKAIYHFRRGTFNCLFASSIAEEGIDIPDCDVVIRFDLYNSMIQYIQSRGRARQLSSRYINMMEEGNMEQQQRVAKTTNDAKLLKNFCNQLPRDRLVDLLPEVPITAGRGSQSFTVESTGAKLMWYQSLDVLARFTSSLSQDNDGTKTSLWHPEYIITSLGKQYLCQVLLPSTSPITSQIGNPQRSKHDAKCSAAFELCIALIKAKYIDGRLQPTFVKKLPAMRNARLAISSKKRAGYPMMLKPKFWAERGPSHRWYVTVIALEKEDVLWRKSQPIVLVSRKHVPAVPFFSLYFGQRGSSRVVVKSSPLPIELDDHEQRVATTFTSRLFRDVFSKEFNCSPETLPYFLLPCSDPHHTICRASYQPTEACIQWEAMEDTMKYDYVPRPTNDQADAFYPGRFCLDPFDGARKFYVNRVRHDMSLNDPVPEGVPTPRFRRWKTCEKSIREYSINMWGKGRETICIDPTQPVVEAELISLRRNLLDETEVIDESRVLIYVVMEPMKISTIPTAFAVTLSTFPSVIHRMDDFLIVREACTLMQVHLRSPLALAAFTKNSDAPDDEMVEWNETGIQGGMGENYERLEFIGDTFLKLAVSVALYVQNPDSDEFAYHVERMILICNRNLFNTAVDMGIPAYVRSKAFDRRAWYPDGLPTIRGKLPKSTDTHNLGDKPIADVMEAIIGAAYVTGMETNLFKTFIQDRSHRRSKMSDLHVEDEKDQVRFFPSQETMDEAVRAVSTIVRSEKHKMKSWDEYYRHYKIPVWQNVEPNAAQVDLARRVEAITGYSFRYPALLRSAFKHPSSPWTWENIPHYQRLEFLGDALLDMACVEYLYLRFPHADPQWLTEHKMAMVSNQFLGFLCVKLDLYKHISIMGAGINAQIHAYVTDIQLLSEQQEQGVSSTWKDGGDRSEATTTTMDTDDGDNSSYWVDGPKPPKCLPDIVEAYVGAIFVDASCQFQPVRQFFYRFVEPYFRDMSRYDTYANQHPMTMLANLLGTRWNCRHWRVLLQEQPMPVSAGAEAMTRSEMAAGVMIHGEVVAVECGESGRYAKMRAARVAVSMLEGLADAEFRRRYHCDCTDDVDTARYDHGDNHDLDNGNGIDPSDNSNGSDSRVDEIDDVMVSR